MPTMEQTWGPRNPSSPRSVPTMLSLPGGSQWRSYANVTEDTPPCCPPSIAPRPRPEGRSLGASMAPALGAEVLGLDSLDELPEPALQLVLVGWRLGVVVALEHDALGVEQRLFGVDGRAQPGGQGDGI